YAAAVCVYAFAAYPTETPAALKGTAADPAIFMDGEVRAKAESLSLIRSLLYFLSFPWEWAICIVLLFSGGAANWQERIERHRRLPSWMSLPLYVLLLHSVTFLCLIPLRLAS